MAEIVSSIIAEKLKEKIGSEIIKEICSMWGYKDELDDLSETINTIKNVLLDADSKRDLNNFQKGYISKLKDVVYDADDLFDEFHTLAKLGEIDGDKGDKFLGKVRGFFSSLIGKLCQSREMSRKVKEIKDQIDGIAKDYTKFGFNVDYKPIVRRREETCSYIEVKDIIGRDKDKDAIIELLMAPDGDDKGFRFLTIVGVGGLGKTALAQLVFNDETVQSEFSSFRFWVCVSDQDGVEFDVKTILCKILEVVTKKKLDNGLQMELVQTQFQEQFENKKYLLVLDDVWNESRINWDNLKTFLMMGASGSRIVVTSRSERTGNIIGSNHVYKLEGLSREDSQHLFEIAAFDGGEKDPEFVKIGENIVKKCCGTPLAIKVVGSLLYGQDISKWQSIERSGLNDIGEDDKNYIFPILKLSYFNLTPSLKSCFSYCALFPKDHIIYKEDLIEYWIAQGFIIPLDGGQSVEDAAEEHFSILMRRCFFQDIRKDYFGNVEYLKIHDLMHDIALEVGKQEFCVVNSQQTRDLGEKVRHVFTSKNISLSNCKIRTCLFDISGDWLDAKIENLTALRVLGGARISRSLTENIGKMLLLRYLSFERNKGLEVLPNSVTRLYNLRTLILRGCSKLREVPNDFSNLINLRSLDMYGCEKLNKMPLGINNLTNLRDLTYYVASNKIADEEFKGLQQVFSKLKGRLNVMYDSESIQNLIKLEFTPKESEWVIHVADFEKLELSPYLKTLRIQGYKGKVIPWSSNSFPQCLTIISIKSCRSVEEISALSKILHLKVLTLIDLEKVEYMENEISSSSNDTKFAEEFFPSLEELWIEDLPNLKQWWKGDFPAGVTLKFPYLSKLRIESCTELRSFVKCSSSQIMIEHHFPKLNYLEISNCCNLEMNLVCPTLEELELKDNINECFVRMAEMPKLRKMWTNKEGHLKLIPPTNNCLTFLALEKEIDVESAVEGVQRCASSLQTLLFYKCENMKRLPRLDHLIVLERLLLSGNKELSTSEEDEEPWKSMPESLRYLQFYGIPKMRRMPKGMQHLTFLQSLQLGELRNMEGLPEWINCLSSLQSLSIYDCEGIKSLPESFKDLTSLKKLTVRKSPDLEKRCEEPNGEDFYKIQHIPKTQY